MFGSNGTIDQQIIYTREEIDARLQKEITAAKRDIRIAVDRLDHALLVSLLTRKVAEGLRVEVIITQENQQSSQKVSDSPLQPLMLKGASVLRIDREAQGRLQQQFCIIDQQAAFFGEYAWGTQEPDGQPESVVLTYQHSTVARLSAHFGELKSKAFQLKADQQKNSFFSQVKAFFGFKPASKAAPAPTADEAQKPENSSRSSEYEQVLDTMIAAEVSNFDRDMLRRQGYERAKANNGDAQVLSKGLDSVYSVFVNEINVIEDKKTRLISKIEEQRSKSMHQLQEQMEMQLHTLDAQTDAKQQNLQHKISSLESQVAVQQKEIESIRSSRIPALEEKNQQIQQQVKEQERAFVKPAFKWFEFIPVTLINLGLLFYLFFFYSSAAYILLFSELDAKEARLRGITVNPPEVFNPDAISMAADKGGSALMFIMLFVFLPLSLSLIGRFVGKMNWWKSLLMILGIILIDAFIAYKVAEAIHNVDYLTGAVDVPWRFAMALEDLNFYLVFILGALGLFLFKFTFERFMRFFEERDPDVNYRRNQQHIRHLQDDIAANRGQKLSHQEEIGKIEKEIIQLNTEISLHKEDLLALPAKKTHQAEKMKSEMHSKAQSIERTTDIYKTHIENDILPVSVDSLKDRINVFLEGWNDFLHDEYSVSKAMEKSRAAAEVATQWQNEKLNGKRFDQRIKSQ
jgi:hypothetical protein